MDAIISTANFDQAALIDATHVGVRGMAARQQMNREQIDRAAKEFESQFLSTMLSFMFGDPKADPMFGGGTAEEIYRGMLTEEYGKLMSQSGGIGVADQVRRELLKLQEA